MVATISHHHPLKGPWKPRWGDLVFSEWLTMITYFYTVHRVRRKELVKVAFLGTGSEISGSLHFWQSGWIILEGAVAAELENSILCGLLAA